MKKNYIIESKKFFGNLSNDGNLIKLNFSISVGASGEVDILMDKLPLGVSTKFILNSFCEQGTRFESFKLDGISEDNGTQFECDNLIFTGYECDDSEEVISLVVSYSMLKMMVKPFEEVELPNLSFVIKGFRSYQHLSAETELGIVEMVGAADADQRDELSGLIKITSFKYPEDLDGWFILADDFCNHLLHVMSFAVNADLELPCVELRGKNFKEIKLYSRNEQKKSTWPTFSYLYMRDIFKCAVQSYFKPKVKNLYFAIKWFNMNSSYREANLISSMTVLENLIDSNLKEEDCFLLGNKSYELLRKKLSNVVKDQLKEWTEDDAKRRQILQELNNRFSNLKRRSLIDKLNLLARRWGVNLDGIDEGRIKEAKSARDQVVHKGHYVQSSKSDKTLDLHDHVLVVREIVVRFILTALDFDGKYFSYIDGQKYIGFNKNVPDLDCNLIFVK